jgi:hypothetical protein
MKLKRMLVILFLVISASCDANSWDSDVDGHIYECPIEDIL